MKTLESMDIFFLSFNESNREKNWLLLKSQFSKSRRLHGIKGLALAHQMCAQRSKSPFFFVVNADNEILKEFRFELPEWPLKQAIYVWRSLNPVNQLIYGFGGVKLYPRSAFPFSSNFIDLSSSFFKTAYKIVPHLASVTHFNSSPLEAWRGAFRECVKLSSQCIFNQNISETEERLHIWCTKGENQPFGNYVLLGARQGRDYGWKYRNNHSALNKINNFLWLEKFFLNNAYNKVSTDLA